MSPFYLRILIFCLLGFCSSLTVYASDKDIQGIQDAIQQIGKKIQSDVSCLNLDPQETVVVLGVTGAGKSTFVNFLGGKKLEGEIHYGECKVAVKDPLKGVEIGHDVNSCTTIPYPWHDHDHNILFWDSPGFLSNKGAHDDIVNAYTLNSLFTYSKSSKVLLLIPHHYLLDIKHGLINALKPVSNLFQQDLLSFAKATSLIITGCPNQIQPDDLMGPLKRFSDNNDIDLSENTRRLTQYLLDEKRFMFVPRPAKEGFFLSRFEGEGKNIFDQFRQLLAQSRPLSSLNLHLTISDSSRDYALKLANKVALNFQTEFVKSLEEAAFEQGDQILKEGQDAKIARQKLKNIFEKIKTINTADPENFSKTAGDFVRLISSSLYDDFMRQVQDIVFLQKLNSNMVPPFLKWKTSLGEGTIGRHFDALSQKPVVSWKNTQVAVKGNVVGISDINAFLRDFQERSLGSLNLEVGSAFYIDEDFKAPGCTFSVDSPYWFINAQRVIDLSGRDGLPHTPSKAQDGSDGSLTLEPTQGNDGLTGHPGQKGGSFLGNGKHFDKLENILIHVNGGKGGPGQNGGNGGSGKPGKDGDLGKPRAEGDYLIYDDKGTPGERGAYGGKGGLGGKGGEAGLVSIKGANNFIAKGRNAPGAEGQKGDDGKSGEKGLEGRNCKGKLKVQEYGLVYKQTKKVLGIKVSPKKEYGYKPITPPQVIIALGHEDIKSKL